jgi:hypothetical protein
LVVRGGVGGCVRGVDMKRWWGGVREGRVRRCIRGIGGKRW